MASVFLSILDLRTGGGEMSRTRVLGVVVGILKSSDILMHYSGDSQYCNSVFVNVILALWCSIDVGAADLVQAQKVRSITSERAIASIPYKHQTIKPQQPNTHNSTHQSAPTHAPSPNHSHTPHIPKNVLPLRPGPPPALFRREDRSSRSRDRDGLQHVQPVSRIVPILPSEL